MDDSRLQEAVPSTGYLIFQAIFLSFTMLVTIFGNVAVCYVVYRTRSITTVTGMSIASLAVADLLRGTLVVPFVIVTSVSHGKWVFGEAVCSLTAIAHTLFGSASVMTLGAVSVDRYIAIIKPLKYATIVTTLRAALLLFIVWFLSAITALMPLFGWSQYIFIPWTCVCVIDWRHEYSDGYAYYYLTVAFGCPFCVLVFCYYKIFIVAKRQSRRVMAMELASVDGNTFQNTLGGFQGKGRSKLRSMRKEKKAALTLFIVMGIFIVCITPYCILYLVASYNPATWVLGAMGVTSMLSFVNSAANPMIYGILNRKFRRVFLEIMSCRKCRAEISEMPIPAISENHTASTVMIKKRLLPRDIEGLHNRSILRFSVAAGGAMACVVGTDLRTFDKLTVGHLPTIEDVSDASDKKASFNGKVTFDQTDNGVENGSDDKRIASNTVLVTVNGSSSNVVVDGENKKQPHTKQCNIFLVTSPSIKSVQVSAELDSIT